MITTIFWLGTSLAIACHAHTPTDSLAPPDPTLQTTSREPGSRSLWTRARGADWPRFLGPTFDSKSPELGVRADWKNGGLKFLWSMELGTSYGIGSVADGRYIQQERVGDVERIRAVVAETGDAIWTRDDAVQYRDMYGYNNGPRGTPAIDGDEVFAMGVAGRVTCTDTLTGQSKWSVDTNEAYGVVQNFFGVGCSPLVLGDAVIVMVGGSPPEDARIPMGRLDRVSPNGSAIVAMNRTTGKLLWKTGDDLASYSSPRTIVIDGKTMVIVLARDGLLCIDPATGKTLWQYHYRADILESVNAMVPVVVDDQIFLSDCYGVGSVILRAGLASYEIVRKDSENRREQAFRAHWATPIAVGRHLFGCSGRNEPDSDLRCIDWLSGKLLWSDGRRSRTSLMHVDDHFVVLDENGLLQLIKADHDQMVVVSEINLEQPAPEQAALGQTAMGKPYWAAPILSHGLLFVRGAQHVACFEIIGDD